MKDKITDPSTAARIIESGHNLFISGFTAGYPKLIPQELVRRAGQGEKFKINLFAGASTGDQVDGALAGADVVNWRRPYMSDRVMRQKINSEGIKFKDDHLSRLAGEVRSGNWGRCDVAIVEAAGITEKGQLIPTMSVGNTPTYVREADRIIVEICAESDELEGIHDIYIPEDPPYRMPIPIYRASDRIGKPYIDMDPDRVSAIVFSDQADTCAIFSEPDRKALRIAEQILDFVSHEIRRTACRRGSPGSRESGTSPTLCLTGSWKMTFSKTCPFTPKCCRMRFSTSSMSEKSGQHRGPH